MILNDCNIPFDNVEPPIDENDAPPPEDDGRDQHDAINSGELVESDNLMTPEEYDNSRYEEIFSFSDQLAHIKAFAQYENCDPIAFLFSLLAVNVARSRLNIVLPKLNGREGSLNMMFGSVGEPGFGKGTTEYAAKQYLGVTDSLHETSVASGQGVARVFAEYDAKEGKIKSVRSSAFFSVAEIDSMTALKSTQGSILMPILRQMWSGEAIMFPYAAKDKELRVPAQSYRMSMIVGIQPLKSESLLDEVTGGTLQRFVWFPATSRRLAEAPDNPVDPGPRPIPVDQNINTQVTYVFKIPTNIMAEIKTEDKRRRAVDLSSRVGKTAKDSVNGHRMQCREKLAVAIAMFHGRDHMTDADWRLSGLLIEISDETREIVYKIIGDNFRQQKESQAIAAGHHQITINTVTEADNEGKAYQSMLSVFKSASEPLRESRARELMKSNLRKWSVESLQKLIDNREIVAVEIEGKRRCFTAYKKV